VTMSLGPGAFEPSPVGEFIPATIVGLVDETSLPLQSVPGEDELWLIQAPGDVTVEDLRGLRFKVAGSGAGEELCSFKAGGKKYRMVQEDLETTKHMFVLPPCGSGSKNSAQFAQGRPLTRRVTLMRKAKEVGGEEAGGESAKTPGTKKKKRDKESKSEKKSAKKSKK
jgi:hypothetical protein